jgi:hypothetical protein
LRTDNCATQGNTKYLGTQEAGKKLLLYGVGDDALALLKKQYINFGDATIHSMIQHLQEKTAIKMTTSQKFEYKAEGYGKQWDPTTSITAYFTSLDKFLTYLADRGITTSIKEMTMAAGIRMWEARCSPKTKWLHGGTKLLRSKPGRISRTTSRKNG